MDSSMRSRSNWAISTQSELDTPDANTTALAWSRAADAKDRATMPFPTTFGDVELMIHPTWCKFVIY
jgi:hypothetical protein